MHRPRPAVAAIGIAFALAALLLFFASPASAWQKPFEFSVTGRGVVKAVPDIAWLTLSVRTRAKTAAAALEQNTQAMRRVFGTLKERFAIAEADLATSGFGIDPVYFTPRDEKGRPKGPARLIGYDVSNTLRVRVRDLSRLGAVIDAVVRDGANRIRGISFGFSDRRKLLDEARRKAVADAKARASLYAKAVGFRLGPVIRVDEEEEEPVPVRRMHAFAKAMPMEAPVPAPVPVAAGEQSITVSVTITWEAMSQ